MFPLHYQKATASINIITASLSMISFTTANSTTLAPLNVTTTSGSSLSSTFSPTSSNSAIAIAHLKVSLLSNFETKERAMLEISSLVSTNILKMYTKCYSEKSTTCIIHTFVSNQCHLSHSFRDSCSRDVLAVL